jgi:hypothetical protein
VSEESRRLAAGEIAVRARRLLRRGFTNVIVEELADVRFAGLLVALLELAANGLQPPLSVRLEGKAEPYTLEEILRGVP